MTDITPERMPDPEAKDMTKYLTPQGQRRVAAILLLQKLLDETSTDDAEIWLLNNSTEQGWECFGSLGEVLQHAMNRGFRWEGDTISIAIGYCADLLDYDKYQKDYPKETD